MSSKHRAKFTALVTATICLVAQPAGVMAQGTLDRFLSSVEISSAGKCNRIDIRLHRPATYAGHFPVSSGTDLAVRLEPLGTEQTPDDSRIPLRESANVPVGNSANLNAVAFDATTSGGPVIRLTFQHSVAFRVVMDSDSRHLRIDEAEEGDAGACLGALKSERESNEIANPDKPGGSSDSVALGKKALTAKDYSQAIAYFTKAVTEGSPSTRQEAQELLGLARERAGQLVHAKAEYETYLKLYSKGAGAARVRQRLIGVEAAQQDAAEQQFAKHDKLKLDVDVTTKSDFKTDSKSDAQKLNAEKAPVDNIQQPESNLATKRSLGVEPADPNAWTWDKNGSISQYYYRDDNFSSSDILRGSMGEHETLQNEVISSGDFYLHGENQTYDLAIRGAAFGETGFGEQSDIRETNISTIYAEAKHKSSGLFARVGRQSRSTGGIFGRFDGANVGMQVDKDVKVQAVIGSPVFSRDAKPFADKRMFYGASIDYTFPNQEWATALYAIEQDIGSVVDRRALGAELRYSGKELFVYSAADYDIFYNELNNAYVSATWNFKQGASVYGTLDYRHVPFLLTSNALTGQTEQVLSSLVDLFGEKEVTELAADRTASSKSATLGISYPLTEDWTAAIDATIADYTGTPASGGVDALPDPGVEYYVSGQLSGTNLFTENDSIGFGLRYSQNDQSQLYMADISFRYPVNEKLRISPRLRVSLREGRTTDSLQFLVMPSLGLRYRFSNHWNFEVEAGARWEDNKAASGDDQNLELLINAGYRYEF